MPLTHSKEPRERESGGGDIQRTWSHGQVRVRWSGGIWNKPSNEACANVETHQSERDTVGERERDRSLPSFAEISLTSTPSCFVPYGRPKGFEPIERSWRYGVEQYAKFLQRPRDCERERERERERESERWLLTGWLLTGSRTRCRSTPLPTRRYPSHSPTHRRTSIVG